MCTHNTLGILDVCWRLLVLLPCSYLYPFSYGTSFEELSWFFFSDCFLLYLAFGTRRCLNGSLSLPLSHSHTQIYKCSINSRQGTVHCSSCQGRSHSHLQSTADQREELSHTHSHSHTSLHYTHNRPYLCMYSICLYRDILDLRVRTRLTVISK